MNNIILKAENISKQYRLGLVGTGTISHDLNRWWHRIRGKEDPFLKVGAINDRSKLSDSNYVWALNDINFEVKKGEVLGIIGKNGAGKSTLLKILSRVTSPTGGEIKTKGRIASLLEVGTGFHPELTGRENIYLNGAILGMTKAEIRNKEQEIIEFSGCLKYIDTPVKRYSSGMRVRLAFAVAAFLEPDILVIDEVLAVGDAEFQKKAVGKMQDISKTDGRTVLFVSHNMTAVENLCSRAIVLEHGKIVFEGESNEAIKYYLNISQAVIPKDFKKIEQREGLGQIRFKNILIENEASLCIGSDLNIELQIERFKDISPMHYGITFSNSNEIKILNVNTSLSNNAIDYSKDTIRCEIPNIPLVEGEYSISIAVFSDFGLEDFIEKAKQIVINPSDFYGNGKSSNLKSGMIALKHQWS